MFHFSNSFWFSSTIFESKTIRPVSISEASAPIRSYRILITPIRLMSTNNTKNQKKSKKECSEDEGEAEVLESSEYAKPKPDFIDADFDIQSRQVEEIKMTIISHNQEKTDKVLWKINVKENDNNYEVERTFSEFEWLLEELRNRDLAIVLPSIGKGGWKTFIDTKVLKDEKVLQYRKSNLDRFLNKLCAVKEVVNSKPFQIFVQGGSREEFSMFQRRFNEDSQNPQGYLSLFRNPVKTTISGINKLLPTWFSTQNDLTAAYKVQFDKIEKDVKRAVDCMNQILTPHTEYLACLKEYDPMLTLADQEYNFELTKILQELILIEGEIKENRDTSGKERTKESYDVFKLNFKKAILAYSLEVKSELKGIAQTLSKVNQQNSAKISKLFKDQFSIRLE